MASPQERFLSLLLLPFREFNPFAQRFILSALMIEGSNLAVRPTRISYKRSLSMKPLLQRSLQLVYSAAAHHLTRPVYCVRCILLALH